MSIGATIAAVLFTKANATVHKTHNHPWENKKSTLYNMVSRAYKYMSNKFKLKGEIVFT